PRRPEVPVPTDPGLGVEPDPDLFERPRQSAASSLAHRSRGRSESRALAHLDPCHHAPCEPVC
ncbi:hypothetical protein BRD10_04570, partial [Halobacteriales archaeon SW_12_71_31]